MKSFSEFLTERQKDSDNQRLSQERGRSNYGKASVRNVRATGQGGNGADPAERLVAMDARHKAHKEKRGVKTKGLKEGLTGARAQRAREMQDSDIKKGGGKRTDADRDTAFRLGTGTSETRISQKQRKGASDQGKGSGKKDACYHKVKASASVWPSAYASGRLVQCRKKGAANYGNSKKESYSWRKNLDIDEGLTGARAQRAREMQDSDIKKGGGKRTDADRDTAFRLGTGTSENRVSQRKRTGASAQGQGNAAKRRMKEEKSFNQFYDECWKTHKKVGMKMKGGKLVPDCRPKNEETHVYWSSKALDQLEKIQEKSAAWQRKEGKNKTGGLNEKGRKSYERENPGSDLKAPQPGGGPRKRSFCARMSGVKGPMKDEKGRPTRKALALRKWKC